VPRDIANSGDRGLGISERPEAVHALGEDLADGGVLDPADDRSVRAVGDVQDVDLAARRPHQSARTPMRYTTTVRRDPLGEQPASAIADDHAGRPVGAYPGGFVGEPDISEVGVGEAPRIARWHEPRHDGVARSLLPGAE